MLLGEKLRVLFHSVCSSDGVIANICQHNRAARGQNHVHVLRIFFSFFSACEILIKWEYLPPVGPRPPKGFVGLKNAGATCYMNSVIQQLYMIPSIRNSILAIESTGSDIDDDMFSDEKRDNQVNFNYKFWILCVLISYFFSLNIIVLVRYF